MNTALVLLSAMPEAAKLAVFGLVLIVGSFVIRRTMIRTPQAFEPTAKAERS